MSSENMTLAEYYKIRIWQYAYDKARRDAKYNPDIYKNDIYFNDEMDWYIVKEYLSSYEQTETDEKFMWCLGFVPQDFEDD